MNQVRIRISTVMTLAFALVMSNDQDRDFRSMVKKLATKGKRAPACNCKRCGGKRNKVWAHLYPWKAAVFLVLAKYPNGIALDTLRHELAALPWEWDCHYSNAAKAQSEKDGIVASVRAFVSRA